jgi:hypothetical protein
MGHRKKAQQRAIILDDKSLPFVLVDIPYLQSIEILFKFHFIDRYPYDPS